ncbi:hypothetical protein GE09DRAFT_1161225 [Coniochaeta sp. 2T2.1]|nr:hypothetical protein GE09DRAFT_1161225 [Coniochaeta sp. 2T2.1]
MKQSNIPWGHGPGLPPGYRPTSPIPITPWWSSLPPVSRSFCQKAAEDNDSLNPMERLYLLSRLNLPGKALAHPESLSEEERNVLLGRPPRRILLNNIHRCFPVPSPRPEHVVGEDSHGGDDDRSGGGQSAGKRDFDTVAEVADAFRDGERMATLSYKALECVALGWWTYHQDRVPAPWEDWEEDKNSDPCADPAATLLARMGRGEQAFEDAVVDLWCRTETSQMGDPAECAEGEAEDEVAGMLERFEQMAVDADWLREVLRAEVAGKLAELSEGDRAALEELRERMRVEATRDAEEDARTEEAEVEQRRRKVVEEAERKRRKRARKHARRGRTGYVDEDDIDEGYVLGTLVFN